MRIKKLRFGSLNEVINVDDLRCLEQDNRMLNKGLRVRLEWGKAKEDVCSLEAHKGSRQWAPIPGARPSTSPTRSSSLDSGSNCVLLFRGFLLGNNFACPRLI